MIFEWPLALLLGLFAPLVLGLYVMLLRRRRKQAVSYSSVALLRSVLPARSRWKRHVPIAMLVASMGLLAIASARPQTSRDVPTGRTSIVLALDVSLSMCATDVDPNRLTAAKAAASDFVEDQPAGTRMGLVLFAGFAQIAVAPTTNHDDVLRAIDGLTTSRGTAIGAALLKSLDAISGVNPGVEPVGDADAVEADNLEGEQKPSPTRSAGVDDFVPDIVVLLTDGANTRGIEPLDAVGHAVERRVRVYAIGFGTDQPTALSCSSEQVGDFLFRGGGAQGGRRFGGGSPLQADYETLQAIADRTGGKAYDAEDGDELGEVFAELPKVVTTQKEQQEVSAFFVGLGALLAAAAVVASLRWSAYPS